MKKILCVVIAIITCATLTSCGSLFQSTASHQNELTTNLKSIEGLYDRDDNGVFIQQIIDVNGSKDELYVRLLEFLTRTYNDANEVIQVKEKEQGLIVCKGCHRFNVNNFLYGSAIKETAWHVYKAEIKENRVRITITLNEMEWYRPATAAGGVYTSAAKGSYSILDCPPYKTWNNPSENTRKGFVFYYAVSNLINLMDSTKNALKNSPAYKVDNDW